MSLRIESSHQDEKLRAQLHGAGLKLTNNRLSVLDVFLAGTEPVTITDRGFAQRRQTRELRTAPYGDC